MAVQGGLVSISSSAAGVIAGALSSDFNIPGTHGVLRVIVRAPAAGTAYLGGPTVTTAGYTLTSADTPLALTLVGGETLYGVGSTAMTVTVLRMGETT